MKILQINSSIHGEDAASSRIAAAIAGKLGGEVTRRDLAQHPVPHLDAASFAAFNTPAPERTAAQAARVAYSDILVEELRQADTLVLGVPMYNFGVPTQLKAWFDQVARAGVSFRYTSAGPEGLLGEKRVIVVATRGGAHAGTERDSQSAWLKQMFSFLGLGEPEFVYAEGLANPERRDQVLSELEAGAALAAA